MDSLIIKWQQKALVHYKQALTTAVGRKVQQGMGEVYEKCADELAALTHTQEASEIGSPLWDAQQSEVVGAEKVKTAVLTERDELQRPYDLEEARAEVAKSQ